MELCSKGSLRKLIATSSAPLDLDFCLDKFTELLKGLKEAHRTIIHRDLKPENILIDQDDVFKIADFGISKYVDMVTRANSNKGSGTFPYMPPEGWMYENNTIQMDIYSLGIIFFEMLTLQQPFKGPSYNEYQDQHLHKHLPELTSFRNDVSALISSVIYKMTNKKALDRYKDTTDVYEAMSIVSENELPTQVNIDGIIASAQSKISSLSKITLQQQKMQDEFERKNNNLNYSIQELFSNFSNVVDQFNRKSQNERITFKPFIVSSNAYANTCRLNFFGKIITVSFYNLSLDNYKKYKRERHNDYQKRLYSMIMENYTPDWVERDNIELAGKVEVNYKLKSGYSLGWNIVLLKSGPDDTYGIWHVCKFRERQVFSNVAPNPLYFCINEPDFYDQYNNGRSNSSADKDFFCPILQPQDIADLISLLPTIA
jgi:serine/threonine protein kinase